MEKRARKVTTIGDLVVTTDECILIIDNGCDQTIINKSCFKIDTHTGIFYNVGGALGSMSCSNLELVNSAYTLVQLPSCKVIVRINQALLDCDPSQTEALLQPHQARAFGVMIDDCARCHVAANGKPGGQCIGIGEDTLPLHFDGWKCYLRIRLPSVEEINSLPIYELTSPNPYNPQQSHRLRRVSNNLEVSVKEWRARLGYPTYEVTRSTLANTTQMVKTLQAESREYLRDYYKTRVWALRPYRINDVMYSDTFFSFITSIRGYKCFQLFAFKATKFTKIKLMRREAQAPEMYEDIIREHGAPNKTVTDNAKVCTGKRWTTINRRFCIETGLSVPHHQHQNYSEGEGGNLKFRLLKLFHNTPHAPLQYWCFGAEYLDQIGCYLSKATLGGRCSSEKLMGQTVDISVFRFHWFQPVWYYSPTLSFPQDKMEPGFFLKLAESTGDGFAYHVLPGKEYKDIPTTRNPVVLVRCVVRSRDLSSSMVPRCHKEDEEFKFFNTQGDEIFGDEELMTSEELIALNGVPEQESATATPVPDIVDTPASSSLAYLDMDISTIIEEPSAMEEEATHSEECAGVTAEAVVPSPAPTDGGPPHVPMVSQTQSDDEEIPPSDQDPDGPFDGCDSGQDFDSMASHMNNHMDDKDEILDAQLVAIVAHQFLAGILELQVEYSTGETSWHPIELIKREDPHAVADYVIHNDMGKVSNGIHRRWARAFLRVLRRTLKRLRRVQFSGLESSTYDPSPKIARSRRAKRARRAQAEARIPDPPKGKRNFKYGLEVPKNWMDIKRLDAVAGNTRWQQAVEKEVGALVMHQCFDFKTPDYKPPTEYQYCRLQMIYDIKSDLTFKARLVCDGSQIDPKGLSTRATVVKTLSVRLLDLIADAQGLEVLCGDIGNAFIQADTKEKIYTRVGTEFGDRAGCIALIVRALYGLTTSAERFRTLFADFLRSLGFNPTRYDRDVWMRMRDNEDGFDYICTHVDDFKVVAKDAGMWIDRIAGAFLVKSHGPRSYYLGNDYHFHDGANLWTYSASTYTKEAIARVERIFGCLSKESSPLPVTDCHPELDTSPLLGLDDHRKYQMLLGMLQWLVTISRPDLCTLVSSLNRFGACPRESHLDLAVRAFGYLKQVPDPKIAIDWRPMKFTRSSPRFEQLRPDFLEDYPDAKEELDPSFPPSFGPVMETAIMVDSDHAHDQKTRRSLTGLLAFVGSTPVIWMSKRQGSIASSTYAAEFSALRTATEEAMSLRYMLRCLGCNIPSDGSCPTKIFNDNLSVVLNAQNPAADLSKKHVAISFHVVREAVAAGIISPYWLKGKWNISDIMTKQIPITEFRTHCKFLFWQPDFHLLEHNRLDDPDVSD